MKRKLWTFITSILFFSLCAQPAWSASVKKVKKKNVLIVLEGDQVQKGEIYYLINSAGKKRGLIKIRKVSGTKAIAILGKGKARKGWTLQKRVRKKKGSVAKNKSKTESSSSSPTKMAFGFMGGLGMNTMEAKQVNEDKTLTGETVTLKGTGFLAKAFFDFPLFSKLWFRGLFGLEQMVVEGTRSSDQEKLNYEIQFISADFWARFVFLDGSFKPWVGIGTNLLFPASQSGNALDKDSVGSASIFAAGAGADYYFSPKYFIPFTVDYGIYPKTDKVALSRIGITTGFGMAF